MGFHSPRFFVLLLMAAVFFFIAKGKRLWVLAIFDALFYLNAGILDLLLLFGAAAVTFYSGIRSRGPRKKAWALLGVTANLLNLAFFKYYHFILGNVSRLIPVPDMLLKMNPILPIGISFYTFQLVSYLVDVYRDEVPPCRSFLLFWVYISFFGQVIAGPIMRASDFIPQVEQTERYTFDPGRIKSGVALFTVGLVKKLVFADTLAPFVDTFFARGADLSSIDLWIAGYLFAFQIYFDFSAYSDMALGIGKVFGYELAKNFDSPYVSQNPPEFWRRWHITLSTWIRDYLYIPLGGSRRGFARGIFNVVIAMTISGLWHGAAWNFVLWGLYHGLLSAAHRIWRNIFGNRSFARKLAGFPFPLFNSLVFMQFTVVGWILFRMRDLETLFRAVRKMLTFSDLTYGPHVWYYVILISGLYILHLIEYFIRRNAHSLSSFWDNNVPAPIKGLVYAGIVFVLCVFLRPKENAFIYFKF
ncbi:MAG TPA: MBOAT family protein [Firmicutes bacterium]|nr:MBOAT family protein [Candidatus Fermentithermobacillaceae bacterium]